MDPNAWVYPVQIPNDVFHVLVSLGRCQGMLGPHMEAIARYLDEEYLAECTPTMTVIEDILLAVIKQATRSKEGGLV